MVANSKMSKASSFYSKEKIISFSMFAVKEIGWLNTTSYANKFQEIHLPRMLYEVLWILLLLPLWGKFPFCASNSERNMEKTIFYKITKSLYHSRSAWWGSNGCALVFTKWVFKCLLLVSVVTWIKSLFNEHFVKTCKCMANMFRLL